MMLVNAISTSELTAEYYTQEGKEVQNHSQEQNR